MKKAVLYSLLVISMFSVDAFADEQWTSCANFPAQARHRCTAFAIGNKGYVGGGHINSFVEVVHEDFWQYDPGTDSWTQIADFGGGKRYHSSAFSIGEFGYVGLGEDENDNYYNDFYRYVPEFNIWQPVASFPGNPRRAATSFVIDDLGYVGTGQSDFGYEVDFYYYDPQTNSWTQVSDFMGQARSSAVGFSYNGKGYVGTGHIFGDHTKDFFEYDPLTNSWTQKADVGHVFRQDATGFVLNDKGYILTGNDVDADFNYKDVWEYNFTTDTWIQIEDFGAEGRRYMVSVVIGDVAYAGTGTDGTNLNDWYRFDPLLSNKENDKISVQPYPNPSTDVMRFNVNEPASIFICDVTGRQIYSSLIQSQFELQKSEIGTGTFLYQIITQSGTNYTGQIIFK